MVIKKKIKLSALICTYNSPKLIKRCVNSLLVQKRNYEIEVLLIDGGSNNETLKLLNEFEAKYPFIKIVKNRNKLPEGYGKGKWLGWKKAQGEFVLIIDQDNELKSSRVFERFINIFSKEKEIFGIACKLYLEKKDTLTNQYIALQGTDPFLAYRSIDGIIRLNNLDIIKKEDYGILKIKKENLIITGGNCFIYNKQILDSLGGYIQDTENIAKLVNSGFDKFAIPNEETTHHSAIEGFWEFLKKKKKWGGTFDISEKKSFSYFPKNKLQRKEFIKNLFEISFIFPNLITSIKMFYKTRQFAWLMHAPLTFITEFIYGYKVFESIIVSKFHR